MPTTHSVKYPELFDPSKMRQHRDVAGLMRDRDKNVSKMFSIID